MATEHTHKRPDGAVVKGLFCMICGGVTDEKNEGHGVNECKADYPLVNELRRINGW